MYNKNGRSTLAQRMPCRGSHKWQRFIYNIFCVTKKLSSEINVMQKLSFSHWENGTVIRLHNAEFSRGLIVVTFCWKNDPRRRIYRLQWVLNRCAQVVGRSSDEIIVDELNSLHWLQVDQRIVFKVTLVPHKSLHGAAPDYIYRICYRLIIKQKYLGHQMVISSVKNRYKQRYSQRAIQNAAPTIWNAHQIADRQEKDTMTFRKILKMFLFSVAFGYSM